MNTTYDSKQQTELHTRFDQLQRKLIPLWKQIGRTFEVAKSFRK